MAGGDGGAVLSSRTVGLGPGDGWRESGVSVY